MSIRFGWTRPQPRRSRPMMSRWRTCRLRKPTSPSPRRQRHRVRPTRRRVDRRCRAPRRSGTMEHVRERRGAPDAVLEVWDLHARVVESERKAHRVLAGGSAKRDYHEAVVAEADALNKLGFQDFDAFAAAHGTEPPGRARRHPCGVSPPDARPNRGPYSCVVERTRCRSRRRSARSRQDIPYAVEKVDSPPSRRPEAEADEPEAEVDVEAEPEPEAEADVEADVTPTPEPEVAPEPEAEVAPEPEPLVVPEPVVLVAARRRGRLVAPVEVREPEPPVSISTTNAPATSSTLGPIAGTPTSSARQHDLADVGAARDAARATPSRSAKRSPRCVPSSSAPPSSRARPMPTWRNAPKNATTSPPGTPRRRRPWRVARARVGTGPGRCGRRPRRVRNPRRDRRRACRLHARSARRASSRRPLARTPALEADVAALDGRARTDRNDARGRDCTPDRTRRRPGAPPCPGRGTGTDPRRASAVTRRTRDAKSKRCACRLPRSKPTSPNEPTSWPNATATLSSRPLGLEALEGTVADRAAERDAVAEAARSQPASGRRARSPCHAPGIRVGAARPRS